MIPILYSSTESISELLSDLTNGIGRLADCVRCEVTEERNGQFTLEIEYPTTGSHFPDIVPGTVLKVKANPSDPLQFFRIWKVSKPMRGNVIVFANHISYDLNKTSVMPFESNGAAATVTQMMNNLVGGDDFTFSTDITNSTSQFTNKIPQPMRYLLGGQSGSMLDVFGGELKFNNNQVQLLANRGSDSGLVIAYGKNLTDIKQEENIQNMYTAVFPYVVDQNQNAILGDLQTIITTSEPKILNLDVSDQFQGNDEQTLPTKEQINQAAQEYIQANNLTAPKVSIQVSFVDLSQYEEFKNIYPILQLSLCDTVQVNFEKLGIQASAKMIKYVYDSLLERYVQIEIGEPKSTLQDTIIELPQESQGMIDEATGYLDSTISAFTGLIANGLGLFTTKIQVGVEGGYQIYLHNKPTLAESQYQWTINSNGFAVSTDYGKTWSAGFTTSGDAVFNSLSANAINALSIYGSTITFGNPNGTNVVANTTSDNGGIQFTGNGKINFNTNGVYLANNLYTNGKVANQIYLTTNNTNTYALFANYMNASNPNNLANRLYFIVQPQWNAAILSNNNESGNQSNFLQLSTSGGTNDIQLINYVPNSTNYANFIWSGANATQTWLQLVNYDLNGNARNALYFDQNGTFRLTGNTGGTNSLYTDTNGNMVLTSTNLLKLASTNYYVQIQTGGSTYRCVWKNINGNIVLCGETG